jgi:hypothetical protein
MGISSLAPSPGIQYFFNISILINILSLQSLKFNVNHRRLREILVYTSESEERNGGAAKHRM